MPLEPDPHLRRLIAEKGIDRTIPDAGIGPEDVYDAWRDGYTDARDAIERIRKLIDEGHDGGGWIELIAQGSNLRARVEHWDRLLEQGHATIIERQAKIDAALRILDRAPDVPPAEGDEIE